MPKIALRGRENLKLRAIRLHGKNLGLDIGLLRLSDSAGKHGGRRVHEPRKGDRSETGWAVEAVRQGTAARVGRVALCAPHHAAGGGLPALPIGLAGIGASQVKRSAPHVDHREVGRQIILAQDAGIGFRRRFRE